MGVLEHRQGLAAIHLYSELGRQLMKARGSFKRLQQLLRQRPGINQHLRINTSGRAEHQVAYVITGGIARPQARRQQSLNQPRGVAADATDLQIAAVSDLDLTGGKTFGGVGHRVRLISPERAAGQLYPADPTVLCLNDAQQPRTGRGTQRSLGLVGRYRLVQKVTRQS
ncbi:hypothetical protein D3C79_585810 [compost metagenome]